MLINRRNIMAGRFLLLFVVTTTCFITGCINNKEESHAVIRQAMLNDLANRVIEPLHAEFGEKAAALEEASGVFASDPTEESLEAVQSTWIEAALSWRRLSALNLPGPVRSGIYHFRINTWPANLAFIEEAISTTESIDEAYVDQLGSNSRGLPALEYLYFEGGADKTLAQMRDDAQRRDYALAVAQNVAAKSQALINAWSREDGNHLGSFELANAGGRSLQSSLSRVVNEMAKVGENIRHNKLGAPLGLSKKPEDPDTAPDPSLVESPYAEISKELMLEDLSGLRMLMTADGGTGLDDYLAAFDVKIEGVLLGEVILNQIDHTEKSLSNLPGSIKTLVTSDPALLLPAHEATKELLRLIKTDMASWLSISITFSDNDGD